MSVLIDTCVWSLVFRRRASPPSEISAELARLIRAHSAKMIGPIRQELLAGITDQKSFERVRDGLRDYSDLVPERDEYEMAAQYFTTCRRRGVQGAPTDMLLCAIAARREMTIFTTDKDFARYQKHVHVRLHPIPRN